MKYRKVKEIKFQPRPLLPWDEETSHQMWEKSMADGHRVLWFKCCLCSLEYQVRTWREGEDVAEHFPFCPECGSKGSSYCLKLDHEIGMICQALHAPPPDKDGVG